MSIKPKHKKGTTKSAHACLTTRTIGFDIA